jgi:hypothetical protein
LLKGSVEFSGSWAVSIKMGWFCPFKPGDARRKRMETPEARRSLRRIRYSFVGTEDGPPAPPEPPKKGFERNSVWFLAHFSAFLLHAAHTAVMWLWPFKRTVTGTIFQEYSIWEEREGHHEGPPFDIYPSVSQIGHPLELKWFVGAFTALSAMFHLGYSLCYCRTFEILGFKIKLLGLLDYVGKRFERLIGYKKQLENRAVVARFVEYSLSASLMLCLLAYFSGIRTLWHLILIGTISVATQMCGVLIERNFRLSEKETSRHVYKNNIYLWWSGAVYLVVVFVDIFLTLNASNENTPPSEPKMPEFVWGIVGGELAIYFCFGIVQAVRGFFDYKNVKQLNDPKIEATNKRQLYCYRAELTYIILSLIAKSVLAWVVFFNVLMLDE